MSKISIISEIKDKLTDTTLWVIFSAFEIYSTIATGILILFFPITKASVVKKFKSLGIEIGKDIIVHNEKKFYTRAAIEGNFGFIESNMDGDWSTKDLRKLFEKIFESRRMKEFAHPLTWVYSTFNLQTKKKSWEVAKTHYDAGNDIIEAMLDSNLQYTCGYWKDSDNLDDAQISKMNLIARKLQLKPGMKVCDIGCGYGSLGYYLVKNFGVSFVGITISEKQIEYANNLCRDLPSCEFRLCDYRDLDEQFDRIVSIGMFEHIGANNYKTFFEICRKCLKDDGIMLLHTIGILHNCFVGACPWSHKYIFRNSYVPGYLELFKSIENLWIIEDWHNFGFDYSKTLAAWESNFDKEWPRFEKVYGKRFHKMWKNYLQIAQAMFSTRILHLWQIVLSKDGLKGGYHAPR